MNIADLAPALDRRPDGYGAEQLFLCGMKGTGKSTLTRRIIDALPDTEVVVVIDSKHDWQFRRRFGGLGYLFRLFRPKARGEFLQLPYTDLRLVPAGRYVYRPSYPETRDAGVIRIFTTTLQAAKKRKRGVTLVIDEAGDFATGSSPMRALGKLIRESRSMWVRLIIGSQRPSGIPSLMMSEANKFVALHLQKKEDLERVAEYGGDVFATNPPGWHDFNFADIRRRVAKLVRQPDRRAA